MVFRVFPLSEIVLHLIIGIMAYDKAERFLPPQLLQGLMFGFPYSGLRLTAT